MISVEKASIQDASLFTQFEQVPDTKQYMRLYTEVEHKRNICDPNFVYLRILDEGKMVGFFILVLDLDTCNVEFRRVVVSEKGKGIGQSAILAMEQFCELKLRRTRIWLDVFECNTCGRYVYEKLGYERYGESEHTNGKLLLYQKSL